MKKINRLLISLEAISFQKDEKFFLALTKAFTDFRTTERTKADITQLNLLLSDIVRKHTRISTVFEVNKRTSIGAWVIPPTIDRNNPLVAAYSKAMDNRSYQGALIIRRQLNNVGYVDLQKGTVHGIYEKVLTAIQLSTGFLMTDTMEVEEQAAAVLHEVGHIFTYFEYLGTHIKMNYALSSVTAAVMGTNDHQRRVQILEDLSHTEGYSFDINAAAEIKDGVTLQTILIGEGLKKVRSELGSDIYDLKGAEYLADQYAARQGAARANVTGLTKTSMYGSSLSLRSNGTFMIVEAIKAVVWLTASAVTLGGAAWVTVIYGVIANPIADSYDTPKDRFTRIKHQVIEALKDPENTPERRKALLEDLEVIERIEDTVSNRRTLFEYIFTNIVPSHKKQWKQQVLQQELEAIAANPLFIASAKLQSRA